MGVIIQKPLREATETDVQALGLDRRQREAMIAFAGSNGAEYVDVPDCGTDPWKEAHLTHDAVLRIPVVLLRADHS